MHSTTHLSIQTLIAIALKAGEEILQIYHHQDPKEWEITIKSDHSPLSKADSLAAATINQALLEVEPNLLILNEEIESLPYDERKHIQRFCLVDPLDGTKEFIKKSGEFTVNIALFDEGKPILSVVHAPVLNETFYAIKGEGAFHYQQRKRLFCSPYTPSQKGVKIILSRSHLSEETKNYVSNFNTPEILSMGSSLKFMRIASGEAHLYPRLAPTMEWDTAASQLILEEAGGTIRHYPQNTPLQYNKESLKNPWFVASANSD